MNQLGPYLIEAPLGRGATAQVFRAVAKDSGARVALKVFHADLWGDAELKRRVLKEAKVVSELKHSNIIQVLNTHFELDPPAIAMELVDGVSLEEFQPRLPYILPEVAVLIALEVLEALAYAHAKGVIHRDLKPANIMISSGGRVLVADFGLAKTSGLSQATLSGTVVGSPDFMSPEQSVGDVVTPRSDLFSLSAVLYFLVTGTKPFARASAVSTLAAVSKGEAEPAQRRNPKLSARLAGIIAKGMARDPSARFQSAQELIEALRGYLASVGIDPSLFTLPAWVVSPTTVTAETLKTVSEALIRSCDEQIAKGQWSQVMELLSHLGQVSPESGAIPRLIDSLEQAQNRARKKRMMLLSCAGAAAVVALAIGAASALRHLPSKVQAPQSTGITQSLPGAQGEPQSSLERAKPAPIAKASAVQKAAVDASGEVQMEIPPGVTVYWDGKLVDQAKPLRNVRPGEHNLRMEREGAQPIVGTIQVKSGEPTVIKVR